MSVMQAYFQLLDKLIPSYFSSWFRYGVGLMLASFMVFKLLSLESALEHQQKLSLKNSVSFAHQQTLILKQLDCLEHQLTICESAIKAQHTLDEEIKVFRMQLEKMKDSLNQVQIQTSSNHLLSVYKQAQSTLMNSANTHSKIQLKKLKQKSVVKVRLPFQVLNIDSWNGEPMVMIHHQDHTDLLSKYDTLAGWTVVEINFDAGWVRFKNRRDEMVKSCL